MNQWSKTSSTSVLHIKNNSYNQKFIYISNYLYINKCIDSIYKTYIYTNVSSLHCNTDIDLDDGENRSWGSNGEKGLFANSGDSDKPLQLLGTPEPGWPTGNWKCVPFVEYLGLSIKGLNEFQNVKALVGSIAGVVLPRKGLANVTIGVCSDCANARLNWVFVGIPVIGGGFGLNLVTLNDCDDFPFDRFTGEQP